MKKVAPLASMETIIPVSVKHAIGKLSATMKRMWLSNDCEG